MRVELDGRTPDVDPTAWVAPTASVVGEVHVGPGASLWYGAVARGDTESITLGAGSNLQDGAIMHADPGFPTVVGADVTIGHGAIVHGATVEDRVIVGMGATLLNGSRVGSDSIIGAGAVVSEGMQIPPRSLVLGIPAKVRRELSDDEVAKVLANAQGYAAKAQVYARSARTLD